MKLVHLQVASITETFGLKHITIERNGIVLQCKHAVVTLNEPVTFHMTNDGVFTNVMREVSMQVREAGEVQDHNWLQISLLQQEPVYKELYRQVQAACRVVPFRPRRLGRNEYRYIDEAALFAQEYEQAYERLLNAVQTL